MYVYFMIILLTLGRYIPPHLRNKDYIEEDRRKDGPPPPSGQRGYDQRDVRSSYSDHRRGSRGHDDRRGGYDHRGRDSYDRYRGDSYDRRGEDAYDRRGSYDQRSRDYDSYDRRGSDRDFYDRSRNDRQYSSSNRDTPSDKPSGGGGGYDETDSAPQSFKASDDKKDDKFHDGNQYDSHRDTGGRWAQLDYDRRYSGPRYDDRRSSGRYVERRGSLPVRGFYDRDSTWGQYSSGYGHGPPSQWDREEWKRPLPSNPRLEK